MQGTLGLWRESVGRKGVSRVTVYERPDASSLFVEWWDDEGRHKQALKTILGEPVTDKELALEIAEDMSKAQEARRNQSAAEMLGIPTPHTVKELLEDMHGAREGKWSENYTRDQARYRKFWEERIGGMVLTRVNAAVAETVVRKEAHRRERSKGDRDWSPRTQAAVLRYLVDAFGYAERKLKWIEPRSNLSAVDLPRRLGKSEAYTLEEARRLLPQLEVVHWRAGWLGHVLLQTGRRLTAVRTLPEHDEWATLHEDFAVLQFPGETDKARNHGQAVIAGDALRLTRIVVEQGWETPTHDDCRRWLRKAEKAAKVPHRKRRGYHGLKRLFATLAKGHVGRERQSGTTGVTLDRVYVQDELAPKVQLAQVLASKVGGE